MMITSRKCSQERETETDRERIEKTVTDTHTHTHMHRDRDRDRERERQRDRERDVGSLSGWDMELKVPLAVVWLYTFKLSKHRAP